MNDIQALRSHLFDTLTALQDKENPMDIERAKAVCQVGTVIIDSAKAEIDFARVNGSVDTVFFHKPSTVPQLSNQESPAEVTQNKPQVHPLEGFASKHGHVTVDGNVTTHRIK
jgi:hypothetical protein